jgi:hypothetical protein
VIVGIHHRARRLGRRLVLVDVSPSLDILLQALRLDRVLARGPVRGALPGLPSPASVAPSSPTVGPSIATVAPSTPTVGPSIATVAPSTPTVGPSIATVVPFTE